MRYVCFVRGFYIDVMKLYKVCCMNKLLYDVRVVFVVFEQYWESLMNMFVCFFGCVDIFFWFLIDCFVLINVFVFWSINGENMWML